MAVRRTGNRNSLVRGPRRKTLWTGTEVAATGYQAVAVSSKVLLANLTAASLDPFTPATLCRTRGTFSVASDQQAADEFQVGAIGIAVVSEVARATGITAIPGPQTNSDWEGWLYWHGFSYEMAFGTAVGFHANFANEIIVDCKAMRKVNTDEAVVIVAENNSATHVFRVATNLRTLFKLH